MTQQISIFKKSHTATAILMAIVMTLILAYFYAEFILTLINFLTLKYRPTD